MFLFKKNFQVIHRIAKSVCPQFVMRNEKYDARRTTHFIARITIIFLFLVFLSNNSFAQTVTLKSGKIIDGDIVERTSRSIIIESEGTRFKVPLKQISSFSSGFDLNVVPLKGTESSMDEKVAFVESFKENETEVLRFAKKVQEYLGSQDYEKLEALAGELRAKRPHFLNGDNQLHGFYEALSYGVDWKYPQETQEYIDRIKQWLYVYPNSMTAHIALADGYKDLAFSYRGSGYVESVIQQAQEKFKNALEASEKHLIKAKELGGQDPHLYATWITVGSGLGVQTKQLKEYLNVGMEIDPGYWEMYRRIAVVLLPKSGAKSAELEDVIFTLRNSIEDAQLREQMYAIVVDYVRSYVGNEEFLKFNFSERRVKMGFEYLVKEYQESFDFLNSYAWFLCLYKDRMDANEVFKLLGNYWNNTSDSVWQSRNAFNQWRKWAKVGGDAPEVPLIHVVVKKNEYEELKRLIDKGEDINVRNAKGDSPLMSALETANERVALLLLDAGADVTIKNYEGMTALHYAASRGLTDVVRVLLDKKVSISDGTKTSKINPFHYAAQNGFLPIVKLMYESDSSIINRVTRNGNTALHFATEEGRLDVLQWLLRQTQIEMNTVNQQGNTPLHSAVLRGQIKAVTLLINAGANINAHNKLRSTALNLAQYAKDAPMIKLLEDNGALADKNSLSRENFMLSQKNLDDGLSLYNQGQTADAQAFWEQALKFNPNSDMAYYYLSLLALKNHKDYQNSLTLARKSIELNPRLSGSYFVAGRSLFLMDKRSEALEYFKRLLQLEPDSNQARDLKRQFPELR